MFVLQLRNGAEILDWRLRPGGLGEKAFCGTVLAQLGENEYDNYVTWDVAAEENPFDAFSGHYFQKLEEAKADFAVRASKL